MTRLMLVLMLLFASPVFAQTTPSPDCTATPPAPWVTDSAGGRWTVASGNVLLNGSPAAGGQATAIEWIGGKIYAVNTSGVYLWTGNSWAPPIATLPVCGAMPPSTDDWACADGLDVSVVAGPHDLGWHWLPPDTTPVTWQLVLNGTATAVTPSQGPMCSSGDLPYHLSAVSLPVGTDAVAVRVLTTGGSATGDVTTVTATAATVKPPKKPKVR